MTLHHARASRVGLLLLAGFGSFSPARAQAADLDPKWFPIDVPPPERFEPRRWDLTRPKVRLTSYNLSPELDHDAEAGLVQTRPTTVGADALVAAEATDPDSGVSRVELYGELRSYCGATSTSVEGLTVRSLPLTSVVDAKGAPLPTRLQSFLLLPFGAAAGLCPRGTQLVEVEVDLHAEAINGSGFANNDALAKIVHGPDRLRVSAHNAFAPCLRELESPFGTNRSFVLACINPNLKIWESIPVGVTRPTLSSVLDLWGAELAKEDVVFLSEMDVADVRWLNRIVANMPGFHVAHQGSTAILSRFPISDVRADAITTWFTGQGVGPFTVTSDYTRATIVAEGRPMVAYAVHWAHRPAPPTTSADNRAIMAARMVNDIAAIDPRVPVFVAGDFNARSAFASPGELDTDTLPDFRRMLALFGGSMPEIAAMESVLRNARAEVFSGNPSGYLHGFGPPVDFVFLRGPYRATTYTNFAQATPSDHPRIAVELERGL